MAKWELTRRAWMALMAVSAARALGQGVSSRNVQPMPRGKPSGLPFHARFVDIAEQAGLRAPVIYGGPTHKDYILETVGCGVAFIDYDNDGWLDIFILSGTRLEAVNYEDYVMSYCPSCQTEGRVLKDRRLSRLLK